MTILITGACGFVGCALAELLLEWRDSLKIVGIDNLVRPGSEVNRSRLRRRGVLFVHGDVRSASDFEVLPAADWVIDAAANPSVLAGVQMGLSSRQLFEHNLASLVNVLEYCKRHGAGLVLLSSSRVYSIAELRSLPLNGHGEAFQLDCTAQLPSGVSAGGISEGFPTSPPISLYGSMKLASELIALEYHEAFSIPVWVNRCGVLAGPGQFGTPDQGIFSYWINARLRGRPLRYIGFDGTGKQVRDALHPRDLAALIQLQMGKGSSGKRRVYNVGGGLDSSMSLAQLNKWCDDRFGNHHVSAAAEGRLYDVPWLVMDSKCAGQDFDWQVQTPMTRLFDEIANHAEQNPHWLEQSGL